MTDTKNYELLDTATGRKAVLQARRGNLGPDCLNLANLNKDLGVLTFDPGFMATAACESRVTFIDGDAGVLLYRGYPIEQLAEK
jgi:citrate synthase